MNSTEFIVHPDTKKKIEALKEFYWDYFKIEIPYFDVEQISLQEDEEIQFVPNISLLEIISLFKKTFPEELKIDIPNLSLQTISLRNQTNYFFTHKNLVEIDKHNRYNLFENVSCKKESINLLEMLIVVFRRRLSKKYVAQNHTILLATYIEHTVFAISSSQEHSLLKKRKSKFDPWFIKINLLPKHQIAKTSSFFQIKLT